MFSATNQKAQDITKGAGENSLAAPQSNSGLFEAFMVKESLLRVAKIKFISDSP